MGGGGSLGEIRHSSQEKPWRQSQGRQGEEPQGRGFQVEKPSGGLGAPFCFLEPDPPAHRRHQGHWTWVCGGQGLPCPRVLGICGRETAPPPGITLCLSIETCSPAPGL